MACLIIVCCHSVFHGTDPYNESHWALAPFQQATASKPAEHLTFIAHIEAAISELRQELTKSKSKSKDKDKDDGDSRPLVVLSGGYTNPNHLSTSEAGGYLAVARTLLDQQNMQHGSNTQAPEICKHFSLEEYATDLFQNVLFSLARFHAVRGTWPASIKVVTHAFKAQRIRMHADAIRWTKPFDVVGIDPAFTDEDRLQVEQLEKRNARDLFVTDPYGARGSLRDKKLGRLWKDDNIEAAARDQPDSVVSLLRWTGGSSGSEIYKASLPWSEGAKR